MPLAADARRATLAALCLLPLGAAPRQSLASDTAPATSLTPEVSDVAVLPPPTPHRVWLLELYSGQMQIVDGDTGDLLSSMYSASLSNFASPPGQRTIDVAESVWSKGNRGTRQDMISVYDGSTLKLLTEIPLPGRMYQAPVTHNFSISTDGKLAYVYNMQPASSVIVVDLERRRVLKSVDIPGCSLAYPWGPAGFSSLCGNGSLATVTWNGHDGTISRGEPFFDAEHDPVLEESPSDARSGRTFFVTYSGVIHPAHLGSSPTIDPPWSLQEAAGLGAASIADGALAWRPGGRLPLALHQASGRMFVLMHAGEHWTHKKPGTELWVVDVNNHRVLRRMTLDLPVSAVAVSQDEKPLIYLIDSKLDLSIRDGNTLEELRKVEDVRGVVPYVPPT
jgi:methylamine dehydrogenase heavy chain